MMQAYQENFGYGAAGLAILLAAWLGPGWLNQLLVTNSFIPHGHCYLWKPGLVWLHVGSDLLIGSAYVAISTTLAYLVYRTRQEIPFHWMFLAFGCFIIACGGTHFMEVWTLWHPTYWLAGGLKLITAIASVTTAIILPPLVPKALALVETAKLSEERRLHLETANQELESLYKKLQEIDQLKTQFFANVSHELRTPLALILGSTERLLTIEDLSQEQQRHLATIDRNARILLKQVNDLLDVSKLEAGKMEVNYAQVDLAQLVRLTAANFDGLTQERQITFAVETPEEMPAQVDAAKVQRILLNLLSNAFKFTPMKGTVRCVLTAALSAEDAPLKRAVIAVGDSGTGVPLSLRETIFERFIQAEGGSTRRFGGTGLGLAIVKEFVELQGGTICVGDAPEGGALFTVELPIVAPEGVTLSSTSLQLDRGAEVARSVLEELRSANPSNAIVQGQEMGKPLILVVEDNPEMNQFITETLATEYRVAIALDGQEGLEQALSLRPDLIVSDVMMPKMSGDRLVCQVRTHPELDATPMVILTARADDDLRVELLRSGAQDYLMKPFSVEELRARIGNLIAIKRVRDLLQQELASQSHDLEALAQEVTLRRRELKLALEALEQQAAELAQANRLKDEFLGIVSHELRTPLNAISGWATLLRSRQLDEATIAKALETIERNAKLQTHLVENLLDISRLLRGKLQLKMSPVQLQPAIELALRAVQPAADAKSIQLKSVMDGSCVVYGDRTRLQQIFQNLLDNAVKFTPEQGEVEIRLHCLDKQAQIRVSDTGEGISAEALPYIFDYFRQADSSRTRKYGGMGLGLAIVRELVNLQKGTVQVESPGEGRGATFTVTFPLAVTPHPSQVIC